MRSPADAVEEAQGGLEAVLSQLAARRAVSPNDPLLQAEIDATTRQAIAQFNGHLEAGRNAQAKGLACALARLFPTNQKILNLAVVLAHQEGTAEEALAQAGAMLTLDPRHPMSLLIAADAALDERDVEKELRHRILLAEVGLGTLPSILLLENLYKALSAILTRSPKVDLDLARRLVAAAGRVPPSQPGSVTEDVARFEHYYRVALGSLDLDAAFGPPCRSEPWPEMAFASCHGETLTAGDVVASEAARDAKAVFLVAADPVFIEKYGRYYAASVLKKVDVPCLVVVHVIGAANNLAALAGKLDVADRRLILTGDHFDPTQVKGRCVTMPSKASDPVPLAVHYQASRFLWLGYFLELLKRPVFVTDIDLVLQRGVADLLADTASADVVLNEAPYSVRLGDRLVANLSLTYPTKAGALFANFLRHYLSGVLSQDQVDRFVDQVALTMARHHLGKNGGANISYFAESDVNNYIFPEYAENNYRFFSIYSGFDFDLSVFHA